MSKIRITEHRLVRAGDLAPNPKNWRRHPDFQVAVLKQILDRVGYVSELIAAETPTGLMLMDGHARAALSNDDDMVPVAVVDLDEEEQALVLAAFDPIGALAEADRDQMTALLDTIKGQDEEMLKLLRRLAAGAIVDIVGMREGWAPAEDTVKSTALETVGYDLISVWPRDGDSETRVHAILDQLPPDMVRYKDTKGFRRRYSRSPALEMERIVRTYMRPGDRFLEVCAGWWTFSMAACTWGYSGEGLDIWDVSLDFGRDQLRKLEDIPGTGRCKVVEGDARDLPYDDGAFDFIYCNPPFPVGTKGHKKYSGDARDLGAVRHSEGWLSASGEMMAEMLRVVKPGGLVVTVVADYRKGPVFVPLHSHWIDEGTRRGLVLHDLVVQTMRTEGVRIWRKSYDRQRTVKAHEYVVVFKKPDESS